MRIEDTGMMLVRAELCDRLDTLRRQAERRGGNVAESAESLRIMAAAYGLTPVARMAEALVGAIADGARGGHTALYLDRLGDAIGCRRLDDGAAEAMLASVSVRLHP